MSKWAKADFKLKRQIKSKANQIFLTFPWVKTLEYGQKGFLINGWAIDPHFSSEVGRNRTSAIKSWLLEINHTEEEACAVVLKINQLFRWTHREPFFHERKPWH